MLILLDECVPARLARELPGHEATTVGKMRWSGTGDHRLLQLAARQFDVFLTVDQSIEYQQPPDAQIAIITLRAPSNEIGAIRPLIPALLSALQTIRPGERRRID